MAHAFDFIVTGYGRSGTTAVANYLSAVEEILCGVEIYGPHMDHSQLLAPDCFLERADKQQVNPANPRRGRHSHAAADKIRKFGDKVTYFGNKTPAYFFRLRELLGEIRQPRALVSTRALHATASSYARRASNPKDTFDAGRVALYAAGDLMLMAHSLLSVDPEHVLIVPNTSVVKDWRAATDRMIQFFAPELTPTYNNEALETIKANYEARKKNRKNDENLIAPEDQKVLDRMNKTGINEVLEADHPFPLTDVIDDLRKAVAEMPANPLRYIAQNARAHSNPKVAEYLGTWQRQAAPSWRRMYPKPAETAES